MIEKFGKKHFFYGNDSSDCDWPTHWYPKLRLKLVSVDDLKGDLDDEESDIDNRSKSEFYMDVEDEYLDKYLISSCHEDTLMDKFVDWLQTDDGHFFGGWMNNFLCDRKRSRTIKTYFGSICIFFHRSIFRNSIKTVLSGTAI